MLAYRNADGGFGHALEPDLRAPASQPAAVELALRVLHEADAWDPQAATGACDWLECVAPPEGGAAFVLPTALDWPRAPWWQTDDEPAGSLITTGLISGTLDAHGVEHPWLDRATGLLWERTGAMDETSAYEMLGVLRFLDHVPDRERARAAAKRVAPKLLDQGLVALDPGAPGEVHGPLEYAPRRDSLARGVFDDATIDDHLDHLAAGQLEDGGWTFNWHAWSPAAELEWRGFVTVDALRVLRTNGRL